MKFKRTVALALATSMVASAMVGCGSSSDSASTAADDANSPVVLHWWGTFSEDKGPAQVVEAFNKIDPNVQVEYTRYVNDDAGNTKLDMTLMSDDTVDVYFSMNDVLLKKRIDSGFAYPLDELFDSAGFSLEEDYDENIKQKESSDGHYYSLPAKRITETILYNQKMFDDAGIPYPDKDWTYDEFLDTARKLTKGEGTDKVYGWFFPGYDAGQPALRMLNSKLGYDWMYTEDGKNAAIDTPDVKDITEKYLARVEEGIEPKYVLSRMFAKTFHCNFSKYVNGVRLNNAVTELENSQDSITNICLNCGFESQRTFNRVFKDRYKLTPREYRKKMECVDNRSDSGCQLSL